MHRKIVAFVFMDKSLDCQFCIPLYAQRGGEFETHVLDDDDNIIGFRKAEIENPNVFFIQETMQRQVEINKSGLFVILCPKALFILTKEELPVFEEVIKSISHAAWSELYRQ